MSHASFLCIRHVAVLSAAGILLAGSARGVDLQGLVQTSPFGSVNAAGPAANQPAAGLEFRGVFADKGEYFFSLNETATHKGLWVGLNEPGNPFTVRTYDVSTETVTVDYQGRSLTLTLKRAKIIASAPVLLPPPGQPPAAVAGAPAVAAQAQPAAGPMPDAQVAEEIRRRRAMRQQTAPAAPAAAQPAPGRPGTPQP
jgi:hypothetical protein